VDVLSPETMAEINPVAGFRARIAHGTDCTLAFWTVDEGAELPVHRHPHEQVLCVEEGRFALTVDGETRELGPGDVVPIPGDVPHGGRALTACRLLDVFRPRRDDLG
jgi:quercetin dioxygenase-like cupin family protein